jgi:PD-(D/E)XK nuclease superfamily protein
MAPFKTKGDLAELKVAADLADRGCRISIPFGEDCDYDLIADYDGRLHRVQVKYACSDGFVVHFRCYSQSLTRGKVRAVKVYTAEMVDWIAVYDSTTGRCFYCPSRKLGEGRKRMSLRLRPPLNNQRAGIRAAEDYANPDFSSDPSMEPAGFEPAASCLQSRRSAN